MAKLGMFTVTLGTVGVLAIATLATSSADPAPALPPCARKVFKTQMIKAACTGTPDAPGGQPVAKAAMRKFVADHRITQCAECHTDQAPNYPLKDTALKHYQELGGK
jgi:mono/diheme cytochrome c family protein